MPKSKPLTIKTEADRAIVGRLLREAPFGTRVEIKGPQRSVDQNALMWGMLTDISRQQKLQGRTLSPDLWRFVFLRALGREVAFLPELDGDGVFPVLSGTSDLSSAEMSELLTLMLSWGDQRGVVFKQKPLPEAAR